MGIRASESNWYDNYAFDVQIDGFTVAAFKTCSGLDATAQVIEYAEGGSMTNNKSPGRMEYADITLERGETPNTEMWEWFTQIFDARTQTGSARESQYKRNLVVRQKDRTGAVVRRWSVVNSWINNFKVGDWDNTGSDKHLESITLSHEGFDLLN